MASTIPPLFRCPISLELMKNPVTLCTGITYERESIEKWISDGNLTCPATMQSISSTELLPNVTLQRLIQSFQRSQHSGVVARGSSPITSQELNRGMIHRLRESTLTATSSSIIRELKSIRRSVSWERSLKPELRAELGSCIMLVLESGSLQVIEEAISIVSSHLLPLSASNHRLVIHSICKILSSSSSIEPRIHAATIVEKLSEADWELKTHLGSNPQVVSGLCEMLTDKSSARSSLRAIRSLLSIRRNRTRLVTAGAVHRLIELLPDLDNRPCTELGLCVLDLMCRSADGRASFAAHELGMFAVAKKMFRVSTVATEFSVGIMWSLCKYSADENMRRKAVDANAFERLLLLLHVDCSPVTKQQVYDLLKLLREVYNEDPCIIASPDQALPGFVPIYPRC